MPTPAVSASASPSPAAALAAESDWGDRWSRLRPWLIAAVMLALTAVVGVVLRHLLREVRLDEVLDAVHTIPGVDIAAALAGTAASYLVLTRYDASALRYVGAQVAERTVLLTSFVAYALSNSVGLGPLSGGVIRMRMYAAAGVEPAAIARVIVFNAVAFGLGLAPFGAVGLLWGAQDVAVALHTPAWLLRLVALVLLAGVGAVLVLCARPAASAPSWRAQLPSLGFALRQLAISAVELLASALVLWFLLPPGGPAFPAFLAFYALAITAGILTHVPGGVGVFEAVMLVAVGTGAPRDAMLAALLLNRGIYYVLPLVVATGLLIVYELRSGVAAPVGRIAVRLSPSLLAALTMVAGVWLIASGVTPFTEDARDVLVALHVPVPVVEASHFVGSVAGLGLLLVARGLLHRLDAAWWVACGLSIVAAILALPKGIAVGEATLLITLVVLLVISRRQFDRRSALLTQHLEPEWLLALAGVVLAAAWVLYFAYRQLGYSSELWWQFELDGHAPRSLRALTAVALLAFGYGLWQLLRPPAGEPSLPGPAELDRAATIVRANPSPDAGYVLVGDKHLMFSPSGRSFLMYGKQGRSWVGLFGPFGDPREFADMVWQFIEMASDHGGRAAFYHVRPAMLPLFLDCGMHLFKLGEHAHVELGDFNLRGGARANLRTAVNRAEREGLVFELVPPAEVPALLPQLRAVSDEWLDKQRSSEKGFSVGRFEEDYVRRGPVAVVRREGRIIAFASLLVTDLGEEACLDLMRYAADAPPATMDFLVTKILLHFQSLGCRRFGLGVSPMAGMAERSGAPTWQQLGRLVFEHGDRFYNFRGLRTFKDKFGPVWEARFLAAPRSLATAFILADVTALIGGGEGAKA
jgi:phosphatidylglycerol lysyltransferase